MTEYNHLVYLKRTDGWLLTDWSIMIPDQGFEGGPGTLP